MTESIRTRGKKHKKKEHYTMHKVFHSVRSENAKDYEPQLISIGPFHRNTKALRPMEELKWRYLRHLTRRNPEKNTLQNYIGVINGVAGKLRSCYSTEQVAMDDGEFLEMMVLDGAFLVEYLVKAYTGQNKKELDDMSWNIPLLRRDLLLLENQIPFRVLELLFDASDIPVLVGLSQHRKDRARITLAHLAISYLTREKLEDLPEESKPEAVHHLLHLYHASLHPTQDGSGQPTLARVVIKKLKRSWSLATAPFLFVLSFVLACQIPPVSCCCWPSQADSKEKRRSPRGIPTATELDESGVRFRKKEGAASFMDAVFDKGEGVMEIPLLSIQEASFSNFRNLVAFEQAYPACGSRFTSHAVLMNSLISTEKDVALLKEAEIIESKLGQDEEVAELFNKLCMGSYLDYEKHYHLQLFRDVMEYRSVPHHKWRAGLKHTYFGNPWSTVSLITAIFLVLLTVAQTFYTIYAYHHPPSS